MEKISNWSKVAAQSRDTRYPVVVMVDRDDCPYCRRVEAEFFAAIFAENKLTANAIFGKISIDDGETIVIDGAKEISTRQFLKPFKADLTPTVLFLDAEGNQLMEKMVGLSTPDFYGYYLEQAIIRAYERLNG